MLHVGPAWPAVLITIAVLGYYLILRKERRMYDHDDIYWRCLSPGYLYGGEPDDNFLEWKDGARDDYYPCDAWTGVLRLPEAVLSYFADEYYYARTFTGKPA